MSDDSMMSELKLENQAHCAILTIYHICMMEKEGNGNTLSSLVTYMVLFCFASDVFFLL